MTYKASIPHRLEAMNILRIGPEYIAEYEAELAECTDQIDRNWWLENIDIVREDMKAARAYLRGESS